MMGRRAAIYCRISDDRRGDAAGVDRQRADCLALCEREGWQLVGEYVDNDMSAFSGRPRERYAALLEAIKRGDVDVVVAWHPDRLHRRPIELETFLPLLDAAKVTVVTVKAGLWDLSTPSGKMIARQLGAVASYESEHKSDRIRSAMVDNANKGKPHGRRRTYGMVRETGEDGRARYTLVPEEAEAIREAAKRIIGGEPLWSVVRDFNDRGLPTVTGVPWSRQTLRTVLMSARIAGWREHTAGRGVGAGPYGGGEFAAEAEWPAIVDRPTVERLRATLADPTKRRGTSTRSYLLSGGLLICGQCGTRMTGRPIHNGGREYHCPPARTGGKGCGGCSITAQASEDYVVEMVRQHIGSGDLANRLRADDDDTDAAWSQVADLERDLAALADAHGRGAITVGEWLAAREPMAARLETARHHLSRLRDSETTAIILAGLDEWDREWEAAEGNLARRRAMLQGALAEVQVGPAVRGRNRFDGSRLDPTWRG